MYLYKSTTGKPVNIDNFTITVDPGLELKYANDVLDSFMGVSLSRYTNGVLDTIDDSVPVLGKRNPLTGIVEIIDPATGLPLAVGGQPAGYNAPLLKKWRMALGKVRNGDANAKVLIVGDSTVSGSGSTGVAGYGTGTRAKSFPVKLAAMLNTHGVATRADSFVGFQSQAALGTYDSRFVLTGWTLNMLVAAIGGTLFSGTDGATIAFTPTVQFDRAEVMYVQGSGRGNFTINIDGGATLATVTGAGASVLMTQQVSTTLGTHTLNIVKSGTQTNYITGIRVWNSATREVELIQAGAPGAQASDVAVAVNVWDGLNEITKTAPDLTIINLAINAWVLGTNLATYLGQMQSLITAAKAVGDVILTSGVPSQISSASLALQQTYVDGLKALAASNDCVFLDTWRRFESWELSLGIYTDNLHPNGAGYSDFALAVYEVVAFP